MRCGGICSQDRYRGHSGHLKIEGIDEALKKFMGTFQNVYSFFVMYANLEQVDVLKDTPPVAERAVVDRWILSRLHTLIDGVRDEMENYQLTNAPRAIEAFVDDLSNWYVRRTRDRFWGAETGPDKQAAYATLYEVLVTVAKLAAPFVPFLADELYRNLVCSLDTEAPLSVHLAKYPVADAALKDAQLETDMAFIREVISMGHAAAQPFRYQDASTACRDYHRWTLRRRKSDR